MGSRERRRRRVQGSRAEHDSQLHPRLVTDTAAAGTAPGVAFASVSVAASHFHEETLARLLIKSAFQSATRALQTSLAPFCANKCVCLPQPSTLSAWLSQMDNRMAMLDVSSNPTGLRLGWSKFMSLISSAIS